MFLAMPWFFGHDLEIWLELFQLEGDTPTEDQGHLNTAEVKALMAAAGDQAQPEKL